MVNIVLIAFTHRWIYLGYGVDAQEQVVTIAFL